jgi:arsenite methyltransferase
MVTGLVAAISAAESGRFGEEMKGMDEIKKHVKKRYGRFAKEESSCCSSCGEGTDAVEQAKSIGYSEEEIASIPPEATMGLGCGNPTALAGLKEGEIVLDLGSGAGVDAFLASKKVGVAGKVIGVDMTPEMIDRANELIDKYGYTNIEFRLGEIEKLPVESGTVDVIISNCVINLTPDKVASFKEAYRVLKTGGRILVSDLVTDGELPEDIRRSFDAWAECIAGALEREEYLDAIREAGFLDIRTVSERAYSEPGMDGRLDGRIISVQIEAYK